MSTAPVGGQPLEPFVDAIRPHADRPLNAWTPPECSLSPKTGRRGLAPHEVKCRAHGDRACARAALRVSPRPCGRRGAGMGASPAELTDAESAARTSTESQVSCRIGVASPPLYVLSSSPVDKEAGCRSKTPKRQGERRPCYGRAGRFWKTDIFLPDQRIRGLLFAGPVAANVQLRFSPEERSIFLVTPRLPSRSRTSPNSRPVEAMGKSCSSGRACEITKPATEKDACVPAPERDPVRKVVSSPRRDRASAQRKAAESP
jgi:hypothetical protein